MDNCVFCMIRDGIIPSKIVYEDELIMAFNDINPQAPVHILVTPKEHIDSLDLITNDNSYLISHIFEKIPTIASEAGLVNGYRVVSNCGSDGCQSVSHVHFHILGGAKLLNRMA